MAFQPTIKLITLGDSDVGKTSILIRFSDSTFTLSTMKTYGIDSKFRSLRLGNRNYTVQVWDTAGQEKFRTLNSTFYSRADGILLVYDVTNPESLLHVSNWMAQIRERTREDVPVTLVGNKTDLAEDQDFGTGEEVASKYGIKFYTTSAKTGENIDTAISSLATEVITRHPRPSFDDSQTINISNQTLRARKSTPCCHRNSAS